MTNELARLNVKVPADLHRRLRLFAVGRNKTLADVIVDALERLLQSADSIDHEQALPSRDVPVVPPRIKGEQ